MKPLLRTSRGLELSIGSVLSAFLLVFGIQALVQAASDPIGAAVVWLVSRAGHADAALKSNEPLWGIDLAYLFMSAVFLAFGIRVAFWLCKKTAHTGIR